MSRQRPPIDVNDPFDIWNYVSYTDIVEGKSQVSLLDLYHWWKKYQCYFMRLDKLYRHRSKMKWLLFNVHIVN